MGMNYLAAVVARPCALMVSALLAFAPTRLPAQRAGSPALVELRSDSELASYLRDISLARLRRNRELARCTEYPAVTIDSSTPEEGEAVIRGRVFTTTSHEGVSGALLSVAPVSAGAETDAKGNFELRIPPARLAEPESVSVAVRRIGYTPITLPLVLRRGLVVKLDLPLCFAQVRLQEAVVSSAADESRSLTNDQVAGVDEGGIVKRHGDHLVILHRGRIFTVDVSHGRLRRVAMVDAPGPGINGRDTWYDELLISGDKVTVIGYSYRRRGLEIGIFRISDSGRLRYLDSYNLRSDDYYSSRNYSSRLIGSRLILYSPLLVHADTAHPLAMLPSLRRWQPGNASDQDGSRSDGEFRPVAMELHAYRPTGRVDLASLEMLHSVTTCDLAAPELKCESTLFFGGYARSLYVSRRAVYLASELEYAADSMRSDSSRARATRASLLYRIPFDDGRPAALRMAGMPIDQFSFLERDGELDVLLRAQGYGDLMWAPEQSGGQLALLRLPLAHFDDGTAAAPRDLYTPLPEPMSTRPLLDRFVSGHLLYADGSPWGTPDTVGSALFVVSLSTGKSTRLDVSYGISRIDALGRDAMVIGSDTADLHFTAVRFGERPTLAQRYILHGAAEAETRSHGFYYMPDGDTTGDTTAAGTFGLPVAGAGRGAAGSLDEVSSAILFVRNEGGAFRPLGKLEASADRGEDDGCRVSCIDWYGNARPLFMDDRIFALLGYELVEGELRDGSIVEKRRISIAPRDRS